MSEKVTLREWADSVWTSPLPSPEARAREALKFVRVSLKDGYLTDISISMLLVELKRRGITIQ